VMVVLTPGEYEILRRAGALTGPGTASAALRAQCGMPEKPYGASRPVLSEAGYLEASDRALVVSAGETMNALLDDRKD
jgi:uncharacterized protein (DUF2141 family)